MPRVTVKFRFTLPFEIRMVEGQITSNLEISVGEDLGKVIIYPPVLSKEEGIRQFGTQEKMVLCADTVLIDVQLEVPSLSRMHDFYECAKSMADKELVQFLRSCRHRSKQFWINPNYNPEYHSAEIVHENGERLSTQVFDSGTLVIGEDPNLSLDNLSWKLVQNDLQSPHEFPFEEQLLLDAKFHRLWNGYREAVVNAAVFIELVTIQFMRKELTKRLVDGNITTSSQVDKFLQDVSNRLLVTVGLGLISTIPRYVLEKCRKTLQLRNDILHGKRKSISSREANSAIEAAEELLSMEEIQRWLEGEEAIREDRKGNNDK